MTPEQIIEMAKQSEIYVPPCFNAAATARLTELQAFAKLVRNATLEEAAMKCDQLDFSFSLCEQYVSGAASAECADQIRSMKS